MGSMIDATGRVFCKKEEKLNVRFDFSELAIKEDGDNLHLFFWAETVSAYALEKESKKWTAPAMAQVTLNAENGHCSQFLIKELKERGIDKFYSGFISLDDTNGVASEAIKGVDAFVQVARATILGLMEIPALVNLKAEDLKAPAKRSGGYGGSVTVNGFQPALEAGKQRLELLCSATGIEAQTVTEWSLAFKEAVPDLAQQEIIWKALSLVVR